MVRCCSIVFVILLSVFSAAQAETTFARFRLLTVDGKHVAGSHAQLAPDSLRGRDVEGKPIAIDRQRIRALDVANGSNAGKGAAIGGALGLLTGLVAVLQVEADETRRLDTAKVPPVVGGLAVGCALIGVAVGAGSSHWQPVSLQAGDVSSSDGFCGVEFLHYRF